MESFEPGKKKKKSSKLLYNTSIWMENKIKKKKKNVPPETPCLQLLFYLVNFQLDVKRQHTSSVHIPA